MLFTTGIKPIEIKRGDIYWVDCPDDSTEVNNCIQRFDRPAIIVSNDKNNANSSTLEVVYLTTAPKKPLPTHCTITNAARTSTALCEQVTTISKKWLGNYAGHLNDSEMKNVERCILISLGIESQDCARNNDKILIAEVDHDTETSIKLVTAEQKAAIYQEMYERLLERVTK